MKNNEEEKAPLFNGANYNLANIFQLGIVRTLWKSHVLHKNNDLREALGLAPRQEVLPENAYDQDATNLLSQIDFSSLGESCNMHKVLVLTFAGCGLTPNSAAEQDDAVDVVGADDSYLD